MLIGESQLRQTGNWILAFMQRRVLVRVILIALSFTTVSVALLTIQTAALDYWYLYYSPVLLAAFSFGLRGAALASAAAALHVLALHEWAVLASSQYGSFTDRVYALLGGPQRQLEAISRVYGQSPDEVARQLVEITQAAPDLAMQSARAGLGLILVIGAGALTTGWLIDQNRRKEQILMRLATTDALTGVWNRRSFQDRLRQEIDRGRRTKRSFALLIVDIDYFKRLNDTHGHLAGDAGLRQIAERITQSVRSVDIVSRYGGEEFAVILVDVDPSSVSMVAERVRSNIASTLFEVRPSVQIPLTASVGYALYPKDATEIDEIIHRADSALYHAKETGRNRVIAARDLPPALVKADATPSPNGAVEPPPVPHEGQPLGRERHP